MSLIINGLQLAESVLRTRLTTKVISPQLNSLRSHAFDSASDQQKDNFNKNKADTGIRPLTKDRSIVIPVETSIKYLASKAYKLTYGSNYVWQIYKRNYKGRYPPRKTRKLCIRNNLISTGSPCPICRDEYLVVHYTNTELLKQFISEQSGEVLSYNITSLCQKAHGNVLVAILQARDRGL